jgi:hypothetical protein
MENKVLSYLFGCASAHIHHMTSFVFASFILDTGSSVPDNYSATMAVEIITSWTVT